MIDALIYVLIIGTSCTAGIFIGLYIYRHRKK